MTEVLQMSRNSALHLRGISGNFSHVGFGFIFGFIKGDKNIAYVVTQYTWERTGDPYYPVVVP